MYSSAIPAAVRSVLAAAPIATVAVGTAFGQATPPPAEPVAGQIEEITVTAQRRAERLVDVPIAIASLSGDALQAAGIAATVALPQTVPGLRFDLSGAYVQPTIRGVGSALAGPGMSSNVAIYVDGFYLSNLLATDFDLASIQSVNVLKGPQGTLFGRNATGGAILVTTREPSQELGGEVHLAYGSFDRMKFSGYLTGGLSDTVAADLTAYYEQGDGYIEDIFTGDKVADFDRMTVRGKLLFTPSDTTKVTLTVEHRDSDDPTANYASAYDGLSFGSIVPDVPIPSGPTDFGGDIEGGHEFEGNAVTLRADFDVGFGTLTSYTMYRDEEANEQKDYDSTIVPAFAATWRIQDETISQEFNLSSKPGGELSWVGGLFYYQNENKYPFFNMSFGGAPAFNAFTSDIKQTSLAAFADATYQVTDSLYLTAGVRAGQDKSDAAQVDFANPANTRSAEDDWSSITPRLVARYELSPSSNVWASYSQGYKAGIIPIQETTASVDPEKIDAFEIGYKTSTDAVRFDASVFYYDYKDLQIASYIGQTSLTRNAAESTIVGVDVQVDGNVTERLNLRAAGTYTDAKYDSFPGAVDYEQVTDPTSPAYGVFINPSVDATDNDMSRSPQFTGSFGANYTVPVSWGELGFDANLYMTTKFYFDPVNRFYQDAYELLNLRATWTSNSGATEVALYGNNVTDEEYITEVLPGPFAIQQIYGEPAAYGVQLSVKF